MVAGLFKELNACLKLYVHEYTKHIDIDYHFILGKSATMYNCYINLFIIGTINYFYPNNCIVLSHYKSHNTTTTTTYIV